MLLFVFITVFFMTDPTNHLIVFTRYPVPGRTKTRLTPLLGPVRAADLQKRLIERTIAVAENAVKRIDGRLIVAFDGKEKHKLKKWLGPSRSYIKQVDGDLGLRMHLAMEASFKKGARKVVLVGTDIPDLQTDHLLEAFEALDQKDLVLGPSRDGGYWLVGLKYPVDMFHNIKWGTENVLKDTLALAATKNISWHLLETLNDIDTPEDLSSWNKNECCPDPYISVVIPALNEEKCIARTIKSASNPEAEIIVVDGGGTDRTAIIAAEEGAIVIHGPKGRAVQQNLGAGRARGKYLLFLHADTILPKDYMNQVFDAMMPPDTACAAFRFKTDFRHPLMIVIEGLVNFRSRFFKVPYGDQGLVVRKDDFESLGGFPEIPLAEDLAFIRAASKIGRIRTMPAHAVTSARRHRSLGILRTTVINQAVLLGRTLGTPDRVLASIYKGR